jgi:formylglycine-generating enzyme required for sulfatase activity
MKYLEKLPGVRQLKSPNRNRKAWLFLLCWLLLSICGAQAQEVLEVQGLRFRLIPGGTYLLGSPADEPGRYADEALPHRVPLPPFYIAVTEVTNAQYGRFLKATGRPAPLYWEDKNLNQPAQPVVGVSWHDGQTFCQWLTQVTGAPHRPPTSAGRGWFRGRRPPSIEESSPQGIYAGNR